MALADKTTPYEEEVDDLDKKIDGFLSVLGNVLRLLIFFAVVGGFVTFILIPNLDAWAAPLMLVLTMLFQIMFAILFIIIQFVALFWFIGRPRIYWVMPGETGVSFKDYKGNPEVLESAKQVVTLLRGAKAFKEMGGEAIRGLLLVGNPGTGKSYLGQCIATEAGVPFGYLSAPSIQGMFMGMGTMRIMGLYGKARKLAQKYGACILFLDEIDAIGKSRSGMQGGGMGMGLGGMMMGGGSAELNELLNQMDPLPKDSWKVRLLRKFGLRRGKADMKPVLTMAATNIAEVLDPALLRPGRFDRKITVDLPDADGRREIMEYYLARVKQDNLPIERMVGDTVGYTPVAIKYVINESVVVAHWDNREWITYADWSRALENHELGLRQPIKSMSLEDKKRLAYHETGHALAMVKCLPRERLHKVTIIRHGSALGLAQPKPLVEYHTLTKDELLARMRVALASRAAEQLFLGIEMSGAHHDLQSATQTADAIIRQFGMNGSLFQPPALGEAFPDEIAKRQIDKLLNQEFNKVKQMLEEHQEEVHAIAAGLVEKLDLSGDEVSDIIREVEARRAISRNGTNGHDGSASALPGIFSIIGERGEREVFQSYEPKPREWQAPAASDDAPAH
jgi:cell division protease FtsH